MLFDALDGRWNLRPRLIFSVVILALVLAACGGVNTIVSDIEDDRSSFIYGYIDMSDAPTHLSSFTIKRVEPESENPYWKVRVHEGIFYLENVPPGFYQFAKFGGPVGKSSNVSSYSFRFPRKMRGFRIHGAGIYFLGSYKYKDVGTADNRRFNIEMINNPGKRDLLEQLLPYTKGTQWETQLSHYIEKRL